MGISLNGLTPAGTYPGLIKTGDNTAISGTLKVLSDGIGNDLPMAVSTTAVNFTNQLQQGGVAVPTALQVAAKQDTLVSGTNIKTVNSTTILGSGNLAVQDVLVSGTNIKTINGTSVLGSGNIAVVTSPSGVAGAIQFSNGSAFASDAANLFWDDTNNRLGILTNIPTANIHNTGTTLLTQVFSSTSSLTVYNGRTAVDSTISFGNGSGDNLYFGGSGLFVTGNTTIGNGTTTLSARLGIRGSGSTSATTSLLVQNSAGTAALTVKDDLSTTVSGIFSALGVASIASTLYLGANSNIKSNGSGILQLGDAPETGFNRLQFGGATSSFPALKRSSTTLQARLADDSGYAPIDASLYKVGGTNGFTGTGSYTNFTIVGGIITNAS
jgi:hypothetical protein